MHAKTLVLESRSQIQRRARLRYLFAVSAVVSAVGVDCRPWRDGEQHVSSAVSGLTGAAIEADVSQRKFRRDLAFFLGTFTFAYLRNNACIWKHNRQTNMDTSTSPAVYCLGILLFHLLYYDLYATHNNV